MRQEPIPVTGLWFRSDHTGRKMRVLIEVDDKWQEVAEFNGDAQGVTSHIIEPLGLRVVIDGEQQPHKV